MAGKEVWILPDNDAPGRKYADEVASILEKLTPAPRVRVIELPNLPEGGDIVEWIAAHGDAAEPESMREEIEELAQASKVLAEVQTEPKGMRTVSFPEYRPFPIQALAPVIRDYVKTIADSVGCDPCFVALPALALTGAAIGGALAICPKKGWREIPILWAVVIGDSGTAKSPAADPVTEIANAIEDQLEEDHLVAVQKYNEWEASHKVNHGETDGTEKGNREKPIPPKREYFTADDVTIERLIENLLSSPRGILLVQDELAGC